MSVPSVGTVIVHIPSGAARIPKKASMFVFGAARTARMLFTKVMTGYVRFGNRKENNMGFFICGILLGGLIGVGMMCLIYIGRDD